MYKFLIIFLIICAVSSCNQPSKYKLGAYTLQCMPNSDSLIIIDKEGDRLLLSRTDFGKQMDIYNDSTTESRHIVFDNLKRDIYFGLQNAKGLQGQFIKFDSNQLIKSASWFQNGNIFYGQTPAGEGIEKTLDSTKFKPYELSGPIVEMEQTGSVARIVFSSKSYPVTLIDCNAKGFAGMMDFIANTGVIHIKDINSLDKPIIIKLRYLGFGKVYRNFVWRSDTKQVIESAIE